MTREPRIAGARITWGVSEELASRLRCLRQATEPELEQVARELAEEAGGKPA